MTAPNAAPEARAPRVLAAGIGFTEGPLWTSDGRLLVVAVSRGEVYEIDPVAGGVRGRVETGGGPNGLAQDDRGRVWVAQNGGTAMPSRSTRPTGPGLQRLDELPPELARARVHPVDTGPVTAPNDLVQGPDGRIWFTDPDHHGPGRLCAHDPATGATSTLAEGLEYPNGLVVRGEVLLLAETRTAVIRRYRWDGTRLADDGAFAALAGGGADGLTLDGDGVLYAAVPRDDRIAVIDPDGRERESLRFFGPTFPTNLCFAGPARDVLVVTAAKGGRVLALDRPPPP